MREKLNMNKYTMYKDKMSHSRLSILFGINFGISQQKIKILAIIMVRGSNGLSIKLSKVTFILFRGVYHCEHNELYIISVQRLRPPHSLSHLRLSSE
jgi:hypothetical protein